MCDLGPLGTAVADLSLVAHYPFYVFIGGEDPPLDVDAVVYHGHLYAFLPFTTLHLLLQRVMVEVVSFILVGSDH